MLTSEERQSIRKLSESISSLLSDEKLEKFAQAAHQFVDELRELVGSDDVAAKVADMMASVCATLEFVPVGVIGSSLDSTGSAYALAAGSLAGVYTLPPRKDEPEQGSGTAPYPAAPNTLPSDADDQVWPGQYL